MDLAARAPVVQPAAQRDGLAVVRGDVFDVDVIMRAPGARSKPLLARGRAVLEHARRRRARVAGQLHHVGAVVADLLHRHQRRIPVDRALDGTRCSSSRPWLSCTCVVMMCSATVSTASATSPIRCAWPKSRQMPASRASSLALEHRHERRRRRTGGSGSLRAPRARRAASASAADLLEAAHRGGAVVVVRVAACSPACPRCTTSTSNGIVPRDLERRLRFAHRRLAPLVDRSTAFE